MAHGMAIKVDPVAAVPRQVGEVAARLGRDPRTVTSQLAALEALRLVRRCGKVRWSGRALRTTDNPMGHTVEHVSPAWPTTASPQTQQAAHPPSRSSPRHIDVVAAFETVGGRSGIAVLRYCWGRVLSLCVEEMSWMSMILFT